MGRQGPPARGGRRHRRVRRALRRLGAAGVSTTRCWPPAPTASAPRWPSRSRSTSTTRSGSTWSGMLVDDLVVCGAEPLFMTDYIACGKVVPERIAAIVKRHRRGLRASPAARCSAARPPSTRACSGRTSTTSPARPPGWSRRPTCSVADRVRPGDVAHRDGLERAALQRLLAGPPRAARRGRLGLDRTSTSSAGRWARSFSSPPASTPCPAWL